jgi:hypothetical protein
MEKGINHVTAINYTYDEVMDERIKGFIAYEHQIDEVGRSGVEYIGLALVERDIKHPQDPEQEHFTHIKVYDYVSVPSDDDLVDAVALLAHAHANFISVYKEFLLKRVSKDKAAELLPPGTLTDGDQVPPPPREIVPPPCVYETDGSDTDQEHVDADNLWNQNEYAAAVRDGRQPVYK